MDIYRLRIILQKNVILVLFLRSLPTNEALPWSNAMIDRINPLF